MDRGKRKVLNTKAMTRRGRGRAAYAPQDRDEMFKEEARRQQEGYTIPVTPETPVHISEFDFRYMRDDDSEFVMKAPEDRVRYHVVDYSRSWRGVTDARSINPYANEKDRDLDYRFWSVFHSNFYITVLLDRPQGMISKMQYIDFQDLTDRDDPAFAAAITTCDRFQLTDIMSFRYDWNREILAQFHATYFLDQEEDEMHWMTDGRHYKVNFVTFCRILGFGFDHRRLSHIHAERRLEPREVSFMWEEQGRVPDWSRTKLKSSYYIMNNLIRTTINPKDNATDLNGYITNVLSRFPNGERFCVPRFIWVELGEAMDDGRRRLPYAPYLMFVIERVTGRRYNKDCTHTPYKIKKTRGGAPVGAAGFGRSRSHHTAQRDAPESSSARARPRGIKKKLATWLKAIFGTCSYAAESAYQSRLEIREQRPTHLPPLPPVSPPPRYELPELSESDDDGEDEEEEEQQPQQSYGSWEHQTVAGLRRTQSQGPSRAPGPRRSSRFTSTTHRAGRARVESSEDEAEGEDVDWDQVGRSDSE